MMMMMMMIVIMIKFQETNNLTFNEFLLMSAQIRAFGLKVKENIQLDKK